MASPIQAEEIFQAVAAVLQPDPTIRQQAEQYVDEAYKRPQCALALLSIAAATHIDVGAQVLIMRHCPSQSPSVAQHRGMSESSQGKTKSPLLLLNRNYMLVFCCDR